jgi:hypothetical protein
MTRIFCNGEFCINTNSDFDAQRAIDHRFNELTAEEIAAAGMTGYETFVGPDTTRIEDGEVIFTLPVKPLQTAKDEKHAELKQIMHNKRLNVKVNYDNDTFDANEEAQANMVVLLKAFDLGAQTVSIRSSTEETHVFDKEHCQELSLIMLNAVQAIYNQYWVLKDLLSNCETVEEVEAISWNEYD